MAQGGVLSSDPSPEELLDRLRAQAGDPPLPPLRIADAGRSTRPGPVGRAVNAARRAVLRLISPALGELLSELERDRHRQHAEIAALRDRVSRLEGHTQTPSA